MEDTDENTYEVPLKDQRVFGAGIKRKKVQFVPATSSATSELTSSEGQLSAADRYLSIVLPRSTESIDSTPLKTEAVRVSSHTVCDVCKISFDENNTAIPHAASLAHQVCLEHSYPPSSIDRTRKGLSFLQAWDPDNRAGLGAAGEGILYPIKAKEKRDTVGLGARIPSPKAEKSSENIVKLNAKEVRKNEAQDRRKRECLQQMFYQNDDVQRYLGAG